jgi:hypothetical protein
MPPEIEDNVWVRVVAYGPCNPQLVEARESPTLVLERAAFEQAKHMGGLDRTVYWFLSQKARNFYFEEEIDEDGDRLVIFYNGLTVRDYTEMCLSYTVNV